MPKEIDLRKTKSLGLQLAHILIEEQLEGKIELDRRGGTKFTTRIKAG